MSAVKIRKDGQGWTGPTSPKKTMNETYFQFLTKKKSKKILFGENNTISLSISCCAVGMKRTAKKQERVGNMKLFTIGYAQKSAEELFDILKQNQVRKVIDVRLKNANSYCFYTHKRDFPFLLSSVGIEYEHKENWAPEGWLLDGYKNKQFSWEEYVVEFNKLINERNIIQGVKAEDLDGCALLCAEPTPQMCHRRLLAEFFKKNLQNIEVVHL